VNSRISIAVLIAANLVPVFGVLVWQWDVFAILFLFWCENVAIGVFGILRTAIAGRGAHILGGLFLAAFFSVHYGGFMFGHLMVLISLFGNDMSVNEVVMSLDRWTWIAIAALFVSHAWSFIQNFLGQHEYEGLRPMGAMSMPYKRMAITHVALILGGFLLTGLDEPIAGLLLLLGLKIALDVMFHRKEHVQLQQQRSNL
tara:strand:- start:2107 stop:2706 length:600 start_codon:yes stop_codon:yes gene_type:complete